VEVSFSSLGGGEGGKGGKKGGSVLRLPGERRVLFPLPSPWGRGKGEKGTPLKVPPTSFSRRKSEKKRGEERNRRLSSFFTKRKRLRTLPKKQGPEKRWCTLPPLSPIKGGRETADEGDLCEARGKKKGSDLSFKQENAGLPFGNGFPGRGGERGRPAGKTSDPHKEKEWARKEGGEARNYWLTARKPEKKGEKRKRESLLRSFASMGREGRT